MLQYQIGLVIITLGSSLSFQSSRWQSTAARRRSPVRTATDVAVKPDHTILKIPPVRALMLTTAWKNEAENLRALGYTTKDSPDTIVQKSSAADVLGEMQRWSNQLSLLSKQNDASLPEDHPLKEVLTGMEVLCAMSTQKGTALAFFRTTTEGGDDGDDEERVVVNIEACVGNIALKTNEIAEEALVRHIIREAKAGKLPGVPSSATVVAITCKARVAPSGTTYLPPYYAHLGFTSVKEATDKAAGAAQDEDDDCSEEEPVIGWGGVQKTGREKIGWGGMWTEEDGDEKLLFQLDL